MVVHAYYPLGEPRVQREARAAREAGFDVSVLCLRGPGEPGRETVDGVVIRRAPIGHARGAGIARILFEYLAFCAYACCLLAWRTARRPIDIVHVHNPPDFLVLCGLVPRARGTKLLLDVHDLSAHLFGARIGGRLGSVASVALVWAERLAANRCDRVITVHEPYRLELVRHGIPPTKIEVVMNGVDSAVIAGAPDELPPAEPPRAAFVVAYHGTLTYWYGADLLIDAIAELREDGINARALILGDGDAVPDLRSRVLERSLQDHVHISGRYLPIEQALAIVRSADCGVIPNRPTEINRFALSSKLFEYVALGIPVAVARLQTLAAHFSEEEVAFFEPGDPSSLARAVRRVHDNPEAAREQARRATLRAESYSWSAGRETLLTLYGELITDGLSGVAHPRRPR